MYLANRRPSASRAPLSSRRDLAPDWIEVNALVIATMLEIILYWNGSYELLNWLGPTLLGVIGAWGMWRLIRNTSEAIWSPLFVFRASTIVYLAIGSLTTVIGEDTAYEAVTALYAYSPEEGAKTNTVFMAGYFITILSIKLTSLIYHGRQPSSDVPVFSHVATLQLGLIFATVGIGFIFFVQIPILLAGSVLVLPGTLLLMFGALGAVGTFLVTLWAVERRGFAYLVVAALLAAQLFISLVMLEKTTFMMGVLMVGVAFLLHRPTLTRVIGLAIALGFVLVIISPIVTQGRIIHTATFGDQTGGSIAERLSYAADYLAGFRLNESIDGPSSFLRLHNVAPSAFVITQYDAGLSSDTIVNGVYAVIPRALWPDKPIISAIGTDLNEMITGSATSALGVGVFADAYWNFGWAGLLVFAPVGAFLWWASVRSVEIVRSRDWLLMPFVLVVFRIGMSIDNFLVLAWIAPGAMSVILLLALRILRDIVLRGPGGSGALPVRTR